MVDKEGTCVAVSVFNIAQNKGFIIGDSIAIPEPYVTDNNFKYQEKVLIAEKNKVLFFSS